MPIHVIDQDQATAISWPITVDYSHDATLPDGTRFFDDPNKRAVVEQATNDWAYFFDGAALDSVAAGSETTQVDDASGWYGSRPLFTNTTDYRGFLLYATGVETSEVRSTGYPSPMNTFQSIGGVALDGGLHRSGALEIENDGNYNTRGWIVSTADDDWHLTDNLGEGATDLASIVHHEMGHALFFDVGYSNFVPGTGTTGNGTTWGQLTSDDIRAYDTTPGDLPIDFRSHFCKVTNDGALDPASGLGAFGNEYAETGTLPRRRWIITKLDLLAAQAVGYPLRTSMSPFATLAISAPADGAELVATVGAPYTATLAATGGVPTYDWTLSAGALPAGLTLNRVTGVLSGTPTLAGTSALTVRLEDSPGRCG